MDSINEYCARCNRVVTASIRAEAHGSPPPEFYDELPSGEDGFRAATYAIAFCPKCEGAFLHVRARTEPSEIQRGLLLHPSSQGRSVPGLPPTVRRFLESARSCYETGNPEPCVVMCRKCLEAACASLGVKERGLNAQLMSLRDAGVIEPRLVEWAHAVRLAGNDAAHDIEVQATESEARDVLELLEMLLLYIFSIDLRFRRFMQRRAEIHGQSTL